MHRRLTWTIPSLAGGGAEHVLSRLANHFAETGDQVTIITLDNAPPAYPLHPEITRVGLDLMRDSSHLLQAIWRNLRRVRVLRQAIAASRPDCIISFIDQMNILTLLSCRRTPLPVIISERVDPRFHTLGKSWNRLRRRTYPSASTLVVQTAAVANHFRELDHCPPVVVIPNGIAPRPSRENCSELPEFESTDPRKWIVAMGRLTPQKGFDLLIAAFARLADRFPDWSLLIPGEGPELGALRWQISQARLSNRIRLPGWVPNPECLLSRSEFFVLSSRYEGFPNVLLEAMACGLPAVSFDCPSGPAEIVRDGIDGLLVPAEGVTQLAAAMQRLMEDEPTRRRMGKQARDVATRYSEQRMFARWEELIDSLPGHAEPPAGSSAIRPPTTSQQP